MNNHHQLIWVLTDNRPGNYSQAIGLAEKLASKFPFNIEIKKITYNCFSKLPNFLKIDGFSGIDQISKNNLLNQNAKPDIIISAGRKTAPILACLKKHYQAFAIQIMNPNFDFAKFDLVILPEHDSRKNWITTPLTITHNDENKIIRINGALTRINSQLLETEYQKFSHQLEKITSPKIALLVGGASKKGKFSIKTANNLAEVVSNLANEIGAHLLVLNSRRTGAEITEIIDKNLNCPKTFFKWQNQNYQNPYFAVLQTADFIIATGDSISMCSEICSLGKPVYIFNPEEICSKKHLKFHQNLFAKGFAKKLDGKLKKYPTKKLDETSRISELIIQHYKAKKRL